jgi:hypothetical protein
MNIITVELNGDTRTIKYTYKGEPTQLEYRCVKNPVIPDDVKARWLKDLRSGEFKQGIEGFLRVGDQYCCLGVLVKDMLCNQVIGDRTFGQVVFSLTKLQPSLEEYKWLHGTGSLPVECHGGHSNRTYRSLAELNDFGVPFDVIAQVIEDLF